MGKHPSRNSLIITIDGPAGAGKSTVAKALANRLNISYLDTGAMYRALTLRALRTKTNLENEDDLAELARKTKIQLTGNPKSGLHVFVDGEDVSEEIRSMEVTNNTFYIARAAKVRAIMVKLQQEIGQNTDVVIEGRDVGTVVFPQATWKFYLDADFEERARRRIKELEEKGRAVDSATLKEELKDRDAKDMGRKVGPLKKAEDAIVIDSTNLTIDGTVDKMLEYIEKKPAPEALN